MPTTLDAWLDELAERHPPEIMDFGLDRMQLAMRRLAIYQPDPNNFKTVTVAGTNGKGSCCMLLAAMLTQAGISNGVYLSPHLYDFGERLLINSKMLKADNWVAAFDLIDSNCSDIQLTFFEWVTLAAFVLLGQHKPKVWILEIGLGGRLDAVNALDNQLNLITSIELDHTDRLGNTLAAIASEKAGVMRSNVTTICGSTLAELVKLAATKNALIQQIGRDWHVRHVDKVGQANKQIEVEFNRVQFKAPLPDGCMAENLAMSLLAAHHLGVPINSNSTRWLADYSLPGRQQLVVISGVRCLIDVSHNESSIKSLAYRVAQDFAQVRAIAIFGCLADKQPPKNLAQLFPSVVSWIVPNMIGARSQSAAEVIAKTGLSEAIELSDLTADQLRAELGDGILICFGSFHIAPIVKSLLE